MGVETAGRKNGRYVRSGPKNRGGGSIWHPKASKSIHPHYVFDMFPNICLYTFLKKSKCVFFTDKFLVDDEKFILHLTLFEGDQFV